MKKICFVNMGNVYLSPYINSYIENLSKDTVYDIVYWNRENIDEQITARNVYKYNNTVETNRDAKRINIGFHNKIKGYIEFSKFVSNILKTMDYDYVILLQTTAAILNRRILLKKYKNKYIIDIRDYTFERNKLFYSLEKQLIKNSFETIISSEGYKSFLPNYNYIVTHNDHSFTKEDLLNYRKNKSRSKYNLNIAFIGLIGYHSIQKKILLNLKNHPNFTLSFIGKGADVLREFCVDNNIKNVKIIDKFDPQDTLQYYKDVDLINNLYGNNTPVLDYALSNKLYYAAELHIPILVFPETYMAKISKEYNFGIQVNNLNDNDLGNRLLYYYHTINWEKLDKGCSSFMDKVLNDNKEFDSFVNKL